MKRTIRIGWPFIAGIALIYGACLLFSFGMFIEPKDWLSAANMLMCFIGAIFLGVLGVISIFNGIEEAKKL